jgi:hypothetical protein
LSAANPAAAIIREASGFGITLKLDASGKNVAASSKPPPDLLARLREHKPGILAELALRKALPAGPTEAPAPATTPAPAPARHIPPMTQPPLGVSRTLQNALLLAERHHVRFWIDGDGLLITQPLQAPPLEVHAAMRALSDCGPEIKRICELPERPQGYVDAAWVAAVVDSARLGYRSWRESS